MPMDNVTLENTQQSISSRDAKSVASVMVNGKWVNLSDTLEQANVKSDVGTVSKQVAEQQEVVTSAVAQADSAVAYANDAIEKSRVNSQAIVEINSAVSDAVLGAAVARSDGLRAWNAAQSNADLIDSNYASASAAISSARTEAIAAADEAKASASAAQADIVAVRSDVAAVQADVTANQSDVAVAKSDIAVAKTDLASQATSLSSYVAQASAAGEDITTLKSQAGHFEQEMADTKGDVSQLKISASSASAALSDAAGNISSLQVSAKSYSAALSDAKGDIATVKATASELETKYADAAGDISQIKTDAKGMTQTISDAQGDIAKLKTRADGFDTQFANINGDINKIQTNATGVTQTLTNAKSDIAVLQSRADGFDAKYATAAGDINTLKTNASGFSQTLTNAQGDISTLKSTVSGVQTTLTDAQGNISTLQSDVSGLKKTTSDNTGNISTLQATANTLTSQMSSAQGDISTLKQTASGISSQVSGLSDRAMQNRGTVDSPDFNSLTQSGYYTITSTAHGKNYPTGSWGTLEVSGQVTDINGRLNQKYVSDNNGTAYTRQYNANTKGWTTWVKVANQNDIDTLNGEITANTTAIEQNKNAITLKADQTTVDTLKGTVSQNTATLKTQADQIQSKVSASDVSGMLTGYATQSYAQSLVTQKADQWNLNLTRLQTDVNAIKTTGGGVNLLTGTSGDLQTKQFTNSWNSGPQATNGNYKIKLVKGQTYTYRAWLDNTNGPDYVFVNVRFTPIGGTNYSIGNGTHIAQGETGYSTLSITPPADGYALFTPFAYGAPETFLAKWKEEMLEEGSVAHTWSPAPSDMATVTSVTNLSATVDGIQSQVYNSDGSSKITQLSNVIQTKVGTDDFNNLKQSVGLQTLDSADINNMKTNGHYFVHNLANNPIGGWVYVDVTGDGSSRIRQDVYQDNGTKHKYRRWYNAYWTGWEEGATYTEINQLQDAINLRVTKGDLISQINLQAGTSLIQSNKLVLDATTTVITGDAFIPSAAIAELDADKLTFYGNGSKATIGASIAQYDDDKTKSTINLQYDGGIEIHSSNQQGSILTMHDNTIRLASKSWGDNPNAYQYSGFYAAPNYSLMNTYHRDGTTSGVAIDDNQIHIYGSSKDQQLGALKADVGWYSINGKTGSLTGDQISLKAGNTQAVLTDNNININNASDTNDKNYDVAIHIKGWAEMTGWFTCMGLTQTSLLSTKTRIEPLDTAKALELINSADVATYQYKQEVAHGGTKRHASVIIDDVNDVARYHTPDEIISEDRQGRNDGDIVGYLMGAVQELTKKLKTLESKVG
ncbi:tail fiber domain-containing protein [Limosilactobacillus fermentum]|uniref:tail fiber domain-containing protein n=1 Tax=Limosilactobacillus fermentum TaxID=1613 RepID=UPI003EC0B95A